MLLKDLSALERQFWLSGQDFYRTHVAEDCVMIFPEPAGELHGRQAIVDSLAGAPRWKGVEMTPTLAWQTDAAVLITYRASARRDDADPYNLRASSLYVRDGDAWMLMFHQQTPA